MKFDLFWGILEEGLFFKTTGRGGLSVGKLCLLSNLKIKHTEHSLYCGKKSVNILVLSIVQENVSIPSNAALLLGRGNLLKFSPQYQQFKLLFQTKHRSTETLLPLKTSLDFFLGYHLPSTMMVGDNFTTFFVSSRTYSCHLKVPWTSIVLKKRFDCSKSTIIFKLIEKFRYELQSSPFFQYKGKTSKNFHSIAANKYKICPVKLKHLQILNIRKLLYLCTKFLSQNVHLNLKIGTLQFREVKGFSKQSNSRPLVPILTFQGGSPHCSRVVVTMVQA